MPTKKWTASRPMMPRPGPREAAAGAGADAESAVVAGLVVWLILAATLAQLPAMRVPAVWGEVGKAADFWPVLGDLRRLC